VTPPDPYAEGKASGYAIGYLGCFALFFILIPDVLVWLIAGVLLHTPILGLVGLYIALPIALSAMADLPTLALEARRGSGTPDDFVEGEPQGHEETCERYTGRRRATSHVLRRGSVTAYTGRLRLR